MARGARPCNSAKGYEVIGEELGHFIKASEVSRTSKTSNTTKTLSAAKSASIARDPIFEVVPRQTYGDVT